jgi:hypothetical protein
VSRTIEQERSDAERAKSNPIFGTDFSKPLSAIIEGLRSQMTATRGHIKDIERAYPGWKERVEHVEGLLTCGIIALANSNKEIIDYEIRTADTERGFSLAFKPRGIGLDSCPGCFVCGTDLRSEGANHYMNNISGFVNSKEDGQQIVEWFLFGARLDYRESEPSWIQVKIGSCDQHLPNLQYLNDTTYKSHGYIRKIDIAEAVALIIVPDPDINKG